MSRPLGLGGAEINPLAFHPLAFHPFHGPPAALPVNVGRMRLPDVPRDRPRQPGMCAQITPFGRGKNDRADWAVATP